MRLLIVEDEKKIARSVRKGLSIGDRAVSVFHDDEEEMGLDGFTVFSRICGRLRRKIDDGHEVNLLQTVRGAGYCVKGRE